MIEAAVRTRLLAVAGVSALVSTRAYPVILPQVRDTTTELPAITIQRISEERSGVFAGPSGIPGTLVQIDAWAMTYLGVKELGKQIRFALDGYRGATGGTEGETVSAAILEQERDEYEPDTKYHRCSQDYRVWWLEPAS